MALILGFAIAFVFVSIVAPLTYPFTVSDAAYNLEAARNFMAGNGLVTSTALEIWPVATQPFFMWPPGFPVIAALASSVLGVDPAWLTPKITWLTWALLPAAVVFALRPVLKTWHVHIVGVIVMLSPGAIESIGYAPTDIIFMLLTILWLGLLYRGTDKGTWPILLIVSGALCALAYTIRNAGIAGFVAVAGAYALLALLSIVSLKDVVQRMAWWGVGASLILIPLFAWNLSVFGKLQPYTMGPSQVGFVTNIRYFLAASVNYIFALPGLFETVLWNGAVSAALWAGILILVLLLRKRIVRAWRNLIPHEKEILTVLLAHVLAGAAVVIVARSVYQWGEFIGLRHVMQYLWMLFFLCAVAFVRWEKMPRWALASFAGLTLVIVGMRIIYLADDIEVRRSEYAVSERLSGASVDANSQHHRTFALKLLVARDRQFIQAIKDLPPTTVLVSNLDDLLRSETGRGVYVFTVEQSCDLQRPLAILAKGDRQPESAVALIFPTEDLIRSGCWAELERSPRPRFALGVTRPYVVSLDARAVAASGRSASP